MLKVKIEQEQLVIEDQFLSLELSLNEGLLLMTELDEYLGLESGSSLNLLQQVYKNQLSRLLLLSPRECQEQLQDLSLEGLACLLKILNAKPLVQKLKQNFSSRRLQQLQEEPLYRARRSPTLEQLKRHLSPFFQLLEERIQQGQLTLPSPEDPYY